MNRLEMLYALRIPGDVRDWLTHRLTAPEIDAAWSDCAAQKPRPGQAETWWEEQAAAFAVQLKRLRDGDEVWEFRSPQHTWEHLAGRQGLCVLRGSEVLAIYITMLS